MTDATTAARRASPWQRFWERGGWWRAIFVAAIYLALYIGASQLIGIVFRGRYDVRNPFDDPASVTITLLLPVVIGSALLLAFAASVRWLPELFGRQPGRGRGWMWIAPVIVVVAALLRVGATDWSAYAVSVILLTFLTGLFEPHQRAAGRHRAVHDGLHVLLRGRDVPDAPRDR